MKTGILWRAGTLAAVVVIAAFTMRSPAQAAVVAPGFDLLTTQPGTSFMGAPFMGVPLGSHDFGVPFGMLPTGDTDTIVRRLDPASVPLPPGGETIPIELVALQLVSVVPID
ncbi:MAG: hypothetical protein IH582_07790, partial [Afipia sp.]|nr:hypothetical protein [Afipia sp.]